VSTGKVPRSRRPQPVAVGAADHAFRDLGQGTIPRRRSDNPTDIIGLGTRIDVIEMQHANVGLATVGAWMREQIRDQTLVVLLSL
jgi:hypothetical protein